MKDENARPKSKEQWPHLSTGYFVKAPTEKSEEELDLLVLASDLLRQKWLILLFTVLFAAIAAVWILISPTHYRATVLMAPVTEDLEGSRLRGQFGGLASIVGIDLGAIEGDSRAISLATLTSRKLTTAFIKENNLLPVLFADEWDPVELTWSVDNASEVPSLWDATTFFEEKVRAVSQDSTSGLVTLQIRWINPKLAAEWANQLVDRVNRHRQQEAIAAAERSIAYLKAQLPKTTVSEVQQAIYRLIEDQTKNVMVANVREEYAFKVIDPAVPPDDDDFIWPKPVLQLSVGILAGLVLGVTLALLRSAAQRSRITIESGSLEDKR